MYALEWTISRQLCQCKRPPQKVYPIDPPLESGSRMEIGTPASEEDATSAWSGTSANKRISKGSILESFGTCFVDRNYISLEYPVFKKYKGMPKVTNWSVGDIVSPPFSLASLTAPSRPKMCVTCWQFGHSKKEKFSTIPRIYKIRFPNLNNFLAHTDPPSPLEHQPCQTWQFLE